MVKIVPGELLARLVCTNTAKDIYGATMFQIMHEQKTKYTFKKLQL